MIRVHYPHPNAPLTAFVFWKHQRRTRDVAVYGGYRLVDLPVMKLDVKAGYLLRYESYFISKDPGSTYPGYRLMTSGLLHGLTTSVEMSFVFPKGEAALAFGPFFTFFDKERLAGGALFFKFGNISAPYPTRREKWLSNSGPYTPKQVPNHPKN